MKETPEFKDKKGLPAKKKAQIFKQWQSFLSALEADNRETVTRKDGQVIRKLRLSMKKQLESHLMHGCNLFWNRRRMQDCIGRRTRWDYFDTWFRVPGDECYFLKHFIEGASRIDRGAEGDMFDWVNRSVQKHFAPDLNQAICLEALKQKDLLDVYKWVEMGFDRETAISLKGRGIAFGDYSGKLITWECVPLQMMGDSACSGCEFEGMPGLCRGARILETGVNALGFSCPVVSSDKHIVFGGQEELFA